MQQNYEMGRIPTKAAKMRARKRRRRRRIIKAWCARIIFALIAVAILVSIFMAGKALVKAVSSLWKNNVTEITSNDQPSPEIDADLGVINLEDEMVEDETEEAERITEEPQVTEEPKPTEAPVARISAYGPGEVYYYDIAYEDKITMAKVVYQEARGECFEGQVAVAAVILNRYTSNDSFFHRSSIYALVTQKWQFAPIEGVTQKKLDEYPSCMEAVEQACLGWDPTRATFPEGGATYFFDPNGALSAHQKAIRQGIVYHEIGGHRFHRDFNED